MTEDEARAVARLIDRISQRSYDDGIKAAIQIIRMTAEMYREGEVPEPTLDELAQSIEEILHTRRSHE